MSKTTTSRHSHSGSSIEELTALLREAEAALGKAGSAAGEEAQELRERLKDALSDGQEMLKNFAASARKRAAQADEIIRDNPYAAIGIATGLGVLAGYLVFRSCSNNR